MANVNVRLNNVGPTWMSASKRAVEGLNSLFRSSGINVILAFGGAGPIISVSTDPTQLTRLHGYTLTSSDERSGKILGAEVRLPVKCLVSAPRVGQREAGLSAYEVVVAHEIVHGLGHDGHNTGLMVDLIQPVIGAHASQDKVTGGGVFMPPLQLSAETIGVLKGLWG